MNVRDPRAAEYVPANTGTYAALPSLAPAVVDCVDASVRDRVVQSPMPAALTLKGTDAATLPTSAFVVASRAQKPMRYAARVVGLHARVVALLQSRAIVQLTPSKMNHLN